MGEGEVGGGEGRAGQVKSSVRTVYSFESKKCQL